MLSRTIPDSGGKETARGKLQMEWLALFVIPAVWAKAVFASPYLKTRRHGFSAALACVASLLLFVSLRSSRDVFPIGFGAACIVTAAMFATLLCRAKSEGG
jgi:hypothetical protein